MIGLKKRITIIDSVEFCNGLSFTINLSDRFKTIAQYTSIFAAVQNMSSDKPDIIILDIDNLEGPFQMIQKIQTSWPHIMIIVFTNNVNDEVILNLLSTGVRGYLTKRSSVVNLLIFYLEELINHGSCLSSDIASKVMRHFHKNKVSPLSKRETEVLKLISIGNSSTEIGTILQISKETSKTHIKNIYKKLEVGKKSAAVKKAYAEKLI